jgi:hypothetical protein
MAKKDKKNIFNSLNNLFANLNDKTYNIILSIGSDSNLDRNIERLYTNMIENFNNQKDTALIFISETKTIDFPREIMQQFQKEDGNYFKYINTYNIQNNIYEKYVDKDKDEDKDKDKDKSIKKEKSKKLFIYLIPYYLPEENIADIEDLATYISHCNYLERNQQRDIIINHYAEFDHSDDYVIKFFCNDKITEVEKINLNGCIQSFIDKDFMELLTNFCLNNLKKGSCVNLINNFTFNDRRSFIFCGNTPRLVMPRNMRYPPMYIGNKYLTRIPYIYPLISILSKYDNFSLNYGNDIQNHLYDFQNIINTVTKPKFFEIDFIKKYSKQLEWVYNKPSFDKKEISSYSIEDNDKIPLHLEKNIVAYGNENVDIPIHSFSTAGGKEWLDSYAVIVGINNILKKDNYDSDNFVVLIPDLQYNIKQGNWNIIKRNLPDQCRFIFIPINAISNHWTLLMIDTIRKVGYHFDSLFINYKGNHNKDKKYKNNNTMAKEICNKILERDIEYADIFVKNQDNSYDCGAFILYHLEILIKGCINEPSELFSEFLMEEIKKDEGNIPQKILKIRTNISNIPDILDYQDFGITREKEMISKKISKKKK